MARILACAHNVGKWQVAVALMECETAMQRVISFSSGACIKLNNVGAIDLIDTNVRAMFGEIAHHKVPDSCGVINFIDQIVESFA